MNYISMAWHNLCAFINSPQTLSFATDNRFFIILFVLILSALRRASYTGMIAIALINIPGTVLHECAHFVVGFILNARPTSFSLFPHKQGDVYVTGSVGFRNLHFYNALPSAMAPLLLLWFGYWFNWYFFSRIHLTIWTYFGYILLQCIIIENALPSSTDFKVALKYPLGVLLYFVILITVLIVCF